MRSSFIGAVVTAVALGSGLGCASADGAAPAPEEHTGPEASPDVQAIHVCQSKRSFEALRVEFAQPMSATGREGELVTLNYASGAAPSCGVDAAFDESAPRFLSLTCAPIDREAPIVLEVAGGLRSASGQTLGAGRFEFVRSTLPSAIGCEIFRRVER